MRSDIRFWFRGALVSVTGVSPQTTVLRWLREDQGLTGTKEGCAEGDCGACTVTLGTLDAGAPGGLRLRAVNSCLLFLPALDGKALFTVEDVALTGSGPAARLHPVQQALVDHHASQCGFCTPGFVMSLWADYQERDRAPAPGEAARVLAGNLCRCTGYRPLLDAAEAAWTYPVVKLNREPAARALAAVQAEPDLAYSHGGQDWHAPTTLDRLATLAQAQPEARLLGGATDVGLWVTKGLRHLGTLISTTSVAELRAIRDEGGSLVIGAAASLTDAWPAIARHYPEVAEVAERFASPPVRNAGTLGGNVANGSPIGDSLPVLLALDAQVELRLGGRVRNLPLDRFYLAYQKTAREPGEVLTALRIPARPAGALLRTWKVSKRRDQDISAVCGAFRLTLGPDRRVTEARLAFGGLAATACRAPRAEAALVGRVLDAGTLTAARAALAQDYQPVTDGRATDAYRAQVAANLLTRLQESLP